jgi:hypothetical protein
MSSHTVTPDNSSRRKLFIGLAVVVVLVVGLIVWIVAKHRPTPNPTGVTYVALGDSYSAGEGLGSFQNGTAVRSGAHKNTCHRSARDAYSDLRPPIVLPDVGDRGFWACSGATVTDMEHVSTKQFGQPAQIKEVGKGTKYISLTVGGDDLDFGDIGRACAVGQVHGHVFSVSSTSCSAELASVEKRVPDVKKSLETLYRTLLSDSSPTSQLVVAGYPKILPDSFNGLGKVNGVPFCTFDHVEGIGSIGIPLPDAERVAAFVADLNSAIHSAVDAVGATSPDRIKFTDVYPTSVPRNCRGNTPSASVTGLELSPAGKGIGTGIERFVSSASFHPTKAGQIVYARAIEETFTSFR